MQQRRGTASQWTSANTILAPGEIGYETDTGKFKMGDGSTAWADLSYFKDASDLKLGQADGIATLDSNAQIPVNQLGNLIDGAPSTLDTLNEIVTGLTTVNNYLDAKIATEADLRATDDVAVAAAAAQALSNHNTSTTNVHGIADIASLATKVYADNSAIDKIATHSQDTTLVHGIADTSLLVLTTDPRLSDERVPQDLSVSTAKLANVSVTESKISGSAVTELKIADGAVTSSRLANLSVVEGKLADSAVTEAKIATSAVTETKIADLSVTSSKIADGTILNVNISTVADIDKSKIAGTAITQADLGTVTSSMIADGTIVAQDIADGAITSAKILDGTIVDGDISLNAAISADKISGTAITAADIGTVTSTMIQDGTIVNGDISSSAAISPSKISGVAITAADTGTVTSVMILDGTIVNADINASAAIAQSKIANLTSDLSAKAPIDNPTFTGTLSAGTVNITGDLTVGGTTTTVNASNLNVSDPLIYMGGGNSSDVVDLGFVSSYNDGSYHHAGLARDASDSKWKLFSSVEDEPTTTINFAQAVYDTLVVGGIEYSDGVQVKQGVPSLTSINQQTTSYTSVLTDRDKLVEISSASAVTLTIPTDASVSYPIGTSFDILQTGAGQITIAGANGVTLNATPGLKLRTQWSSATVFKRAANTWVVFGDLTA